MDISVFNIGNPSASKKRSKTETLHLEQREGHPQSSIRLLTLDSGGKMGLIMGEAAYEAGFGEEWNLCK